ncbi:polysaccharide biosynthesis/export family protein [Glaciecola sp. 1036]|uniref:polysaccharide biosynthesis/export family protein n=1 Tax=Alteromonadaceae TaxID=72275 RepID=UPI003CFE6956
MTLLCLASGFAQAQEPAQDAYSLGSGDVIKITVFGQEDLTLETRLSNIGNIKYPFLGEIKLIGRTVDEVEQLIDQGLRGDYLVDPSVSVTVIEYRPFFIDGEVKKPGGYPYQPGLSFDRAVALAGGYTERANKSLVFAKRVVNGQETTLELDSNYIVYPGDIITIPSRFF